MTLGNFGNNIDLVIACLDKGIGVVFLNRSDYCFLMVASILNDVSKFFKLNCDPLEL